MHFPLLRRFAVGLVLASPIGIASSAFAADVNGRIRGTVTDPGGAVLPGVQVIAINQATGVHFDVKTQADGTYIFSELPVGTYTVSITAPGFQAFKATGIIINIDQEYVEAVKLNVGQATETLEVAADAVQVNTTDMQLNNVVDSTQMVELPLIGRGFTGLELIEPGVQASSDRFGSFSVSGSQSQQSEYLINGADTNDFALNTVALSPNIDAIDQFNLIEGPLNAEYDRNSGGIVSATIKQGTNHFHGDIFEFYRDTFLDTSNYFDYVAATPTSAAYKVNPSYHQNIFGGTIGGPILKDKLFFFGAYQGTRQTVPGDDSTGNNLPSVANRTGNFTDIAGTSTIRPVADPRTGIIPDWGQFAGGDFIPSTITIPGCAAGEAWSQCAFDLKGQIPTSSFNSISSNLLNKYVPLPNSGTYGYVFNSSVATSENQYLGRVDFSPTSRNQITVLGIYDKSATTSVIPFTGATIPGFGEVDGTTISQYTFDYVRQLSSTAVNDFALHYTRFNDQVVLPQNVVTPASLGFNISPQNAAAASVPTIAVGGNLTNFTLGFSTNGPQPRIDQVYQIDDNFSKSLGHHQLKFGYDGRRFNTSNPFNARNSGSFNYGSTGGTANSDSSYSTGDGLVDYLLGIPGGYAQGSGAQIQADAFLNYVYAQDTWKVANSLTLSYGLGYSIDTPLHNNQYGGEGVICFIPGEQSGVFSTAPAGITYPGDPGCTNSGQAKTRYNELGPRIGFAWAPDLGRFSGGPGKFSVRGGYGIYYNRTEEETALQTLESPPFGKSTSGIGDLSGVPQFANPFADINAPAKVEANPFPFTFPTRGQAVNPTVWSPVYEFSTYATNFRSPYAENFQLSLEREFASRTVARISYVGSLGRHNQIGYEGNPETATGHAACLADANCSGTATARNQQALNFPTHTAYGYVDPAINAPGFVNVGEVGSESASSYHSLQASVEKGLTHGLTFQLSYTFSHALDNGSSFENTGFGESGSRGYNQYDQALNYGNSAYDARHRLVFAPIYITPLLHGEWFLPKNLALSGWQISGITTVATGFPFDISYAGGNSRSLWCSSSTAYYACPDVPVQTAPLQRLNPRTPGAAGQWFSTATFAPEPIGSFGNISRDPYHGPGINNSNIILAKNFNVSSDGVRRLQLRLESDNAFNHTQFTNPTSTYGASTFGTITSAAAGRQTQLAGKFYF
ncbi:MAG: carboxypeptidase regulatory-like domain-containing protein [Janthinobacterium lividum]